VPGITLPVARIEDLLQGKVWAAMDPERRASRRQTWRTSRGCSSIVRLV
jgi:hypothetical protein